MELGFLISVESVQEALNPKGEMMSNRERELALAELVHELALGESDLTSATAAIHQRLTPDERAELLATVLLDGFVEPMPEGAAHSVPAPSAHPDVSRWWAAIANHST